jgi:F1F0 ATPase subunit 2
MTVDLYSVASAGLVGIITGLLYFMGLWWTLHRVIGSPQAMLWLLLSFVIRAILAAAIAIVVCGLHLENWLGWWIGFLAARRLLVYWTGRTSSELAL